MTLGHILASLESADPETCIVARRPWSLSSDAMLVRLDAQYRVPEHVKSAGFEYFLEVSILKEEVLSPLSSNANVAQRQALAIYYAENDAFPDWAHELFHS